MFTGIVEEIGVVIKCNENKLTINAKKVLENIKLGDSICTNGVCLTVSSIENDYFTADVMEETKRRSNLGNLKIGEIVNLERALSLNDRFGGHIVTGHIDGTGQIIDFKREKNGVWITIKTNEEIAMQIVEKGSICIDGVSLTVAYVNEDIFKVCIIPHTSNETTLLKKDMQSKVNLESDIVGKYITKLLGKKTTKKKSINYEFLNLNGFL